MYRFASNGESGAPCGEPRLSSLFRNDSGNFAVNENEGNFSAVRRFSFQGVSLDSDSQPVIGVNSTSDVYIGLADDNSLAVSYADSSRARYNLYDSSNNVLASGDVDAGYDGAFAAGAVAAPTSLAMAGSGQFVVASVQDPNGDNANQLQVRRFQQSVPPIGNDDDDYVLGPSGPYSGSGGMSVLANEKSADGQPQNLVATLVSQPSYGTLDLHADGSFVYTPAAGFQGIDRFTYQVGEGTTLGNTATVTLLSYHASLVDKLYHQVLHRSAEDSGLIFWTSKLDAGQPLDVVVAGIFNSTERLNALVTQFYQQYLGRGTDPGGLAWWVSDWQAKGDPRDVVENILNSPEFFDDAGDTNTGFVTLLYQRVLQRAAEQGGISFWVGLMGPPTDDTRLQIVSQFYDTHEKHVDLVDFLFREYFQGVTPLPDTTPYVTDLDQGQTETQVAKAIVNNNPPEPAAGSVGRTLYPH